MDIASISGLFGCIAIIIYGIVIGKQGVAGLWNFYDPASVLITLGGSFACMLASFHIKEFLNCLKAIRIIFKMPNFNEGEMIRSIIELSNVARKEGLLALEEAAANIEDPFLKKGILLIVDGTDAELVRNILETEMVYIEERHRTVIGFWDGLGTMGPAWGMIGTLIGLVNMLKNMGDSDSIGPDMATALITTLYGSMLANWICAPVVSKLKTINGMELMMKEVAIEGLLSIQAGENPRVIEEKLKSFLSPQQRMAITEESGGER